MKRSVLIIDDDQITVEAAREMLNPTLLPLKIDTVEAFIHSQSVTVIHN